VAGVCNSQLKLMRLNKMKGMNKIFTVLVVVFCLLVTVKGALGDVIINEIMKDPDAVDDIEGEYIEFYNNGTVDVDIDGWRLTDISWDFHLIGDGEPLNVPAGGYLVLCINNDSLANGGFDCDYQYDGFVLDNTVDEVILWDELVVEVDRVDYDIVDFPDMEGRSMELIDASLDNSDGANWREAEMTFGEGDRGTPGTRNNLLPTGSDGTVITGEDEPYSFNEADFGFNDGDAGDLLAFVRITALESAGDLQLNGVDVVLDQEIAAADIVGGNLAFVPGENENGAGYASFQFQVSDGMGFSVNSYIMTVDVTSSNDAPVVEDILDVLVFEGGIFAAFDLDDYLIEMDGDDVIWSYEGNVDLVVNLDGENVVTVAVPDDDWNGAETVTFRATDDNAEALFDSDDVLFTVLPLNDAPVADDVSSNTDEDTPVTVILAYNDVDAGDFAESCVVSDLDLVGGTVTTACFCDVGTCMVGITPDQDSVAEISGVYTVNDGEANSNVAGLGITINPVNDAPMAVDDEITTLEETLISIDVLLNDSDVDLGDVLSVQSVTNPTHGTAVINGDQINYTPETDYNGEDSFDYTINDGNGETDIALVTVTVTAVNDAPVAGAIPDGEAVQGMEYTVLVNASDVDNSAEELFISAGDSDLPAGMSVDPENEMMLVWTPGASQVGEQLITVVVSDGEPENSLSEQVQFTLTVIPVLNILDDELMANGVVYNGSTGVDVVPGNTVTVSFDFENNFNETLGHIGIGAVADIIMDDLEGIPYEGVCEGSNCDSGQWVLLAGEEGEHTFSFVVDYGVDGDFTLTLTVEDETIGGTAFGDSIDINFNVIKEDADVEIVEEGSGIVDENLTCTKITNLVLELVNTGEYAITPEVLVYNEQPVWSGFDKQTGKFVFSEEPTIAVDFTLEEMDSGETAVLDDELTINATDLSEGEYTLYVYVVNPYFDSDEYFVGDSWQVDLLVESCLNATALEEFFTFLKNSQNGKSADLNDYIIEDTEGYSFTFSLVDETSEEIIDCELTGGSMLSCGPPEAGGQGTSDLTIGVDEQDTLSSLEESFAVTVSPTLDMTNVLVNSQALVEGKTTTLLPDDSITVDVTVTNELDHMVTGVTGRLTFEGNTFESEEEINLAAGQSGTVRIEGEIPLNICAGGCDEGGYEAELMVEGRDYVDNSLLQGDTFEFVLDIQQEPADIEVVLSLEDEEGITCKASTGLTVELTNRGSNDEDDVVITVKGIDPELFSEELTVNSNSQLPYEFTIPAADLSSGNNVLTVEVSYRDDSTKETETIVLNKGSCLSSYEPQDSSLIAADGETVTFLVSLSESGYDSAISWYVDDVLVDSGEDSYTFVENTPGEYEVKVVVNANDEETHVWSVAVTNVPLSDDFETNIHSDVTESELASFPDFTVQNSYGRIVFSDPVDLTDVFNLDEVIVISNGLAAIDSVNADGLDEPATITLYNTGLTNPLVKTTSEFTSDKTLVTGVSTIEASVVNGAVTFDVTGFSTYAAVENLPADLSVPTEVSFDEASLGTAVEKTFTVSNVGATDSLENIQISNTVDSKYDVKFYDDLSNELSIFSLASGGSKSIKVTALIPEDETGGRKKIGDIKFVYGTETKTVPLYIQTESFLEIKSIELNGKSNGDFDLGEENEIEVEVENNGIADIEDVTVKVTIKDIDDDDDLDEESDDFDLDAGDDQKESFDFDIDADLDEDDYEVVVEVEVDGDVVLEETETFDVKRDKHKIVIKDTTLPDAIYCNKYPTLYVKVENQGKSNEDDVVVKVRNDGLGIEMEKAEIELDKYSGSDNDYRASFNLDLNNAEKGTYMVDIEVYRDDELEDSQTLSLTVSDCMETYQAETETTTYSAEDIASQIQQQLPPTTMTPPPTTAVRSSFRESGTYIVLLGILVGLVFIAAILGFTVMLRKR